MYASLSTHRSLNFGICKYPKFYSTLLAPFFDHTVIISSKLIFVDPDILYNVLLNLNELLLR